MSGATSSRPTYAHAGALSNPFFGAPRVSVTVARIAGAGKLFGARGDNMADAADDLSRLALGRPSGLLPFPHLGNADNRGWHRVIGRNASSSLTKTEAENQPLAYRLETYLP